LDRDQAVAAPSTQNDEPPVKKAKPSGESRSQDPWVFYLHDSILGASVKVKKEAKKSSKLNFVVQNLTGHSDLVNCVALNEKYFVSGR
jgi:hypothetical protein